jgi:hypothetical protein
MVMKFPYSFLVNLEKSLSSCAAHSCTAGFLVLSRTWRAVSWQPLRAGNWGGGAYADVVELHGGGGCRILRVVFAGPGGGGVTARQLDSWWSACRQDNGFEVRRGRRWTFGEIRGCGARHGAGVGLTPTSACRSYSRSGRSVVVRVFEVAGASGLGSTAQGECKLCTEENMRCRFVTVETDSFGSSLEVESRTGQPPATAQRQGGQRPRLKASPPPKGSWSPSGPGPGPPKYRTVAY